TPYLDPPSRSREVSSLVGSPVPIEGHAVASWLPHPDRGGYRLCLYMSSTSSSYIASASLSLVRIAVEAQCLRWFRISSRPTARSASCTEEICVSTSAQ